MQRYNSINEAIGRNIELYSELQPGQTYSIEGTPHTYVGREGTDFLFQLPGADEPAAIPEADLEEMIGRGDVKVGATTEFRETVPTYPALDTFTRNTFSANTKPLWQASGVETELSTTDLYTLDELVQQHRLTEMPDIEETRYENLLNDEHWPLLKQYLKLIEPDIDLPEVLG